MGFGELSDKSISVRSVSFVFEVADVVEPLRIFRNGYQSWSPPLWPPWASMLTLLCSPTSSFFKPPNMPTSIALTLGNCAQNG